MKLFCIVAYDLSRDKIGGVQNRMFRFINGLKLHNQLKLIIFNLYYVNPFIDNSKNIEIYNYKDSKILQKKICDFCFNNQVDYLYFVDYRHILGMQNNFFKKNRPKKIIASVPDIDLYRSKVSSNCSSKIPLEKKFFKTMTSTHLDYLHVASEAHKGLVKTYLKDKFIDFIISPVGLFKDNYNWFKPNNAIGITSIRQRSFKNNEEVISFINDNKIIQKAFYFTDNLKFNTSFNKLNLEFRSAKNYEGIKGFYKKALFNINLSSIEFFANGLIEGGYYGAIPIIKSSNYLCFDLFKGNVIFENEFNSYTLKDFQYFSKDIYNFSRKEFNLESNITHFLKVMG